MNGSIPMAAPVGGGRRSCRAFALAALVLLPLAAGSCARPRPIDWCREAPDRQSCLPGACAGHDRTMAVFAADWCPACRSFGQTLLDGAVMRRLEPYGRVWVDTDKNRELLDKYGVESIPTVIFFDRQGREIARFEGAAGPEEFLKILDVIESR